MFLLIATSCFWSSSAEATRIRACIKVASAFVHRTMVRYFPPKPMTRHDPIAQQILSCCTKFPKNDIFEPMEVEAAREAWENWPEGKREEEIRRIYVEARLKNESTFVKQFVENTLATYDSQPPLIEGSVEDSEELFQVTWSGGGYRPSFRKILKYDYVTRDGRRVNYAEAGDTAGGLAELIYLVHELEHAIQHAKMIELDLDGQEPTRLERSYPTFMFNLETAALLAERQLFLLIPDLALELRHLLLRIGESMRTGIFATNAPVTDDAKVIARHLVEFREDSRLWWVAFRFLAVGHTNDRGAFIRSFFENRYGYFYPEFVTEYFRGLRYGE